MKNRSSLLEAYFMYLLVAWTIIIVCILLFGIFQIRHIQQKMVKQEAQANFNKDQALRFWSTRHGGVYVPATETTPSNPYLSHIKERDISGPDGKTLTLMNPAYMLRQTMREYETLYGVRGHITSLKHFRPETAPDEWEKIALRKFEKGTQEMSEFTEIGGNPYYRYMSPMITKIGCLKCHGHQGYKQGDIRGGVSVSIPMTSYLINQQKQTVTLAISMAILWFLGFSGLVIANSGIKKRIRERDSAEAKLQIAHDKLEWEVEERTSELYNELQERKKAEANLKISEERLGLAINGSKVGLWDWNVQKGEIIFNEWWAKIVGYTLEELSPFSVNTWMNLCHPDDLRNSNKLLEEHCDKKTDYYICEVRMKHKNGHWVWIQDHGKVSEWTKDGKPLRITGTHIDVTERKNAEKQREYLIKELREALENIKTLSGLLPICSHCKKIRDDKGYWNSIESYIHEHSEAEFSHGICKECAEKYYPEMNLYDEDETQR